MAQSYLTPENFKDAWDDSQAYMRAAFDPLDEFERIARNRPHPGINSAYPKNTDGTLAAIIQEQPKRTIQQVPTGKIKTTQSNVISIIVNFQLSNEILPHANAQATPLQKSWGVMQKGLTYGAQHSMTFFGSQGDYFGADFKLPYVKDVFFEKGKLTRNDCNYLFVKAWYSCADLEGIIAKEERLSKSAKERGEKYESTWDLEKLRKLIKDKQTQKKTDGELSQAEKEKKLETEGILIVHGFQNGIGAKFYSYASSLGEGEGGDTDAIVRTKTNPDPRGVMPIQTLYANIDFNSPLGRGAVELSGGMQNFIDSSLQAYQYMQGLMMNPPLKKRGNPVKSTLKYKWGALWDMGTDPNSDVEPVNISTDSLRNFASIYGLAKSQIMNLNNSQDTSISGEVGNPGFSKTPTGIKTQEARLGVSDNYMRKQYEAWWEEVIESMVNIHYAEKSGQEEIELDEETADKIRGLGEEEAMLVSEDNKFVVDYDAITEVLKFEADASSSDKQDEAVQLEALDSILQRVESSPMLQQLFGQYPEKMVELYNSIIGGTGVENPEKLQIDVKDFMAKMQEQQELAEQQAQEAEAMQAEQELLPEGELPPEEALPIEEPTQALAPEEEMFADELQQRGIPDETIEQAIIMMRQDIPEEEILSVIAQSMGQPV